MNNPPKQNPSLVIIGGIEQGKSSIISSLWPTAIRLSQDNGIEKYSVADDVPGRGILNYNVTELPSVLYSLQKDWFANNLISEEIVGANVLLFVLPASSFGYKQELAFIKNLLKTSSFNKQHIVICLNKSDHLLIDEEENEISLGAVSKLLQIISSLHSTLCDDLNKDAFGVDSIIPISVVLEWNFSVLKEKLWEGIISRLNDLTYNPNIPTVVIAGKRGCGKSSTLNTLWNLDLPTNKAVACTKYPQLLIVECCINGRQQQINVVDLPGIAESLDADMQYTAYYQKFIEKASLLICLSQADTRAYKQDEIFYHGLMNAHIITPKTKVILGINQIDLLFKTKEQPNGINLNSISLDTSLIQEKINDYYDNVFSKIFDQKYTVTREDVCVFSVWQKWNIDRLMNMIISKITN